LESVELSSIKDSPGGSKATPTNELVGEDLLTQVEKIFKSLSHPYTAAPQHTQDEAGLRPVL
jgi:hypothetical protein